MVTAALRPTAQALREHLRLYLVTDSALCLGRPLADVVAAALHGGVSCVQLREKHLDTRAFIEQAMTLRALLRPLGIPLVVNDRVDVALACEADGVHLGQSDMPVHIARRLLPPHVFIGLSVETLAQVREAATLDVDYLGVSPIHATPTKLDTATPWGLEGLRTAREATALPLVAIGGIHPESVCDVLTAGADGIAVVSAICSAPDVLEATRRLSALRRATPSSLTQRHHPAS
ncbi:MAG: thiamine phosphate synthase [Rhizobacter sp.]|nr:thiamine phosphate synthase [Rhizobacter sp.]